jgi:adenosylhomocysteine nucleosidase
MPSELRPLIDLLGLRRPRVGQGDLWSGAAGRVAIVATTTGIGTQAGRRAAERVLDASAVDHLVVVGVAGGIGPSVDIGDLVVPEFVLDLATGAAYRPHAIGGTASRGTLATSDELIVDPEKAARLERQGVIAIDMETAAIAAVCERRGCPWSVFRAISDRADDASTDPAIFGLAGPDGRPNLMAVARFVLTTPGRIPQLVRLARGLNLATHAAAEAAVGALEAM